MAPSESPPPAKVVRPRPIELVLLVFGLALVTRYAWVMDDAFIYARYADNLLLMKLGLVYNAGEFVEGFSSPLWMLWVTLGRALGLSYWGLWVASGWLGFGLMWWLLIRLDRELAPSGVNVTVNVPLAVLGVSYPVTAYFTSGMETSMIQVCAVGCALLLVRPQDRMAQVLVGLAPLVRPELAAPALICMAYAWSRTRRLPRLALGLSVGLGAALLLARVWYYADLLPNTFYLKHDPDRAQGLRYLVNAFHPYYIEVLLAGVALGSWWGVRHGGPAERAKLGPRMMMWVASMPVVFYVVHIGGDAIHYRYLAFPFCLLVCSSAGVLEAWWGAASRKLSLQRYAVVCAGSIAALSLSLQPPQREVHALRRAGDPHKVHEISDPGRHRRREYLREAAQNDPNLEAKRAIGRDPGNFRYAGIEVTGLCAEAYYKYDRRITHEYGLTDPFLARLQVPTHTGDRPGHKLGVTARAIDVLRITKLAGADGVGVGMMRRSIDGGYGAPWVRDNIEVIEVIERKAFNRHAFGENLGLALSFPGPIVATR